MTQVNLNQNEVAVFQAICNTIQKETGGQFGWADDIKNNHLTLDLASLTKAQLAGYCSQLEQKGLYVPMKEDGYTMIMLTEEGISYARSLGDERGYEAI